MKTEADEKSKSTAKPGAKKLGKLAAAAADKAASEASTSSAPPRPEPEPESDDDHEENTMSLGELLGLTPQDFNRRRRQLRAEIRRRYRSRHSHAMEDSLRKRRLKRERDRWSRIGASAMPKLARIDSMETDGVGLRLVLKNPIDIRAFIMPLAQPDPPPPKPSKKKKQTNAAPAEPLGVDPTDQTLPKPAFVGIDTGRAKPCSAAVSSSPTRLPTSVVFTRRRYYHEMRFKKRLAWEQRRMVDVPAARLAVQQLSLTGGLGNCDPESWSAYLATETVHRTVLDTEFVRNIERAKLRMFMFRAKRSSLDRAVKRVVDTAIKPGGARLPLQRPLVIGIGNGGFPCCGPRGELPAPTAELSKAIKRVAVAVRATGRVVEIRTIDEFRTTMCCCACGAVTQAPTVTRRKMDRLTGLIVQTDGPSRRLRCCTTCVHTGKLRDRDVQASRNILWLTQAEYYGLDRPEYLCRQPRG